MARTQEQRKEETRARLLHAAANQFARKGFHGVSAEAVADDADRTTGALYSHFGNKEGLLFSLVDDWTTTAADAIVADVPDAADLDGILTAAWDAITGDPEGTWLLLEVELWLHGARNADIGDALSERYRTIRSQLAEGIGAWGTQNRPSNSFDPQILAALVLSLLLGSALQFRLDPHAIDAAAIIAAVKSLVSESVSTPTENHP